MSNKYINFFNDKLTFHLLSDECKKIKNINIFSLNEKEIMKISLSKSLISFYINNKKYNVFYKNLIDSGILNNDKKRVIISKTNTAPSNEFFIPILFYYSGNKYCYILFRDKTKFIWNSSIKNRSIWVDFVDIYASLKYSLNIKTKNYLISYSIKNLLEKPELFVQLNKNEIEKYKKEIEEFKKVNDTIPDNLFKLKSNNKNKIKKINSINKKDVGYEAEKYINNVLNVKSKDMISELEAVEDKLKQKVRSIVWNNEFEESFMPYDFKINDDIFLEVKGTEKDNESFEISETEWNFKENKKEKYYLINVYNMSRKALTKIYNFKELNNIEFRKKVRYINNKSKGTENE